MNEPRPRNVPKHWQCAPCSVCERPTWFDPGARAAALAHGIEFAVVCSSLCALQAVQAKRLAIEK